MASLQDGHTSEPNGTHQVETVSRRVTNEYPTHLVERAKSPVVTGHVSNGYAQLALRPATRKTVVTTTTTTTIHFQPLLIPKPTDPDLISEVERARYPPYQNLPASSSIRNRTYANNKVDAKVYPLARARAPSLLGNFKLSLGANEANFSEDANDLDILSEPMPRHTSSKERALPSSLVLQVASEQFGKGKGKAVGSLPTTLKSPYASNARFVTPSQQRKQNCRRKLANDSEDTFSGLNNAIGTYNTPGQRNTGPPRKKMRSDVSKPKPISPTFAAKQIPSPLASPIPEEPPSFSRAQEPNFPEFTPASPPITTDDELSQSYLEMEDLPLFDDPKGLATPQSPLEDTTLQIPPPDDEKPLAELEIGSGLEVSTLMSLPNLVHHFANLPNNLQSHVLFNLLRRAPVAVLQLVNSVIAPALKRDFISDLPPELAVLVLTFVDGASLCQATRVSKKWHRVIDGDGRIWKRRMLIESLWIGDGTEQREAVAIETGSKHLTQKDLFLKRWLEGVWDIDFDARLAARSAAKKIEAARFAVPGTPEDIFGLPKKEYPLAFEEQAIHTSVKRLPAAVRKASDPGVYYIHPYKIIYRRRFLSRRNWTKREPLRMSFQGHGNNVVTCLQFDRQRILAASDDHSINVYSMRRGGLVGQLDGHEGGVWALEYLGDVLVSGSTDRTLRVWDTSKNRCSHIFVGHISTVRCLQIIEPQNINPDPDGPPVWEPPYPLIVSGSRDWTLRVWKLPMAGVDADYLPFMPLSTPDSVNSRYGVMDNPYHLRVLSGHKDAVRALHGAGRIVVSGSYDNTVRVWDILNGDCVHVLRGHSEKVYSVVYDDRRQQCASGSMDGTVKLWSTKNGTCLASLDGHTSLVGLLGLSTRHLVSAAADSTLRVWDATSGKCKHVLAAHAGAITCFQHDDYKVVSGSDGTLKMWNIRTGGYIRDLLVNLTGVWQVGYDDRFCVAAVQRNGQSGYDSK